MESTFNVWKILLATLVFLVFLAWDVARASLRGDRWIQGSALTLTALTVQFLGYFDAQNVDLFGKPKEEELQTLLNKQLFLDVSRLVFCTFLGCVLPGVAFHSSGGRWANIAALAVSLCLHMSTEFHALQNVGDPEIRNGETFIWSSVLLLVAAITLVLYIGLAVINCKFSRDRKNFKVAKMLEGSIESEILKENEGEVSKYWAIVSACQHDFWLNSSAFTSAVLTIVTTCVGAVVGKLVSRQSLLHRSNTSLTLTLCLQCVFIITGWSILIWRWLMFLFLLLSRSNISDPFDASCYVIYTSVYGDRFSRLVYLLVDNLSTLDIVSPFKYIPMCMWKGLRTLVFLIFALSMPLMGLLSGLICLLWVFNCLCLIVSILFIAALCRLKLFARCSRGIMSHSDNKLYSPLMEETLYVTSSSVEVKRSVMRQGHEDGVKYYEDLKKIKGHVDETTQVIGNELSANEDKYEQQGVWKMAAVAAISIIAELAYNNQDWNQILKDAVRVYKGARDLLEFLDFADSITVNPVNVFVSGNSRAYQMSLEADVKILKIERQVEGDCAFSTPTFEDVEKELRAFVDEKADSNIRLFGYWTKYRLVDEYTEGAKALKTVSMKCVCRAIFNESCTNEKELVDRAVSCLGDIIASAVLRLPDVLVQNCRKWAEEFEGENLIKALKIQEKARALAERLTPADMITAPRDVGHEMIDVEAR